MISLAAHGMTLSRMAMDMSIRNLKELQRFAEVGKISASLIHDMSGPLTAAILHLEQDEPRTLSSVRHARRSMRLLERYIEAARQQLSQQECRKIFSASDEVLQLKHVLIPLAKKSNVRLEFDLNEGCLLKGDSVKFQRIIINLVTNSLDAYRKSCQSERLIHISTAIQGEAIVIRVRDWGSGINPEQVPKLFDAFYTTKSRGDLGGAGIGLYNVKRYIEDDFAGKITVISSLSRGSEFRIELPSPINAKATKLAGI